MMIVYYLSLLSDTPKRGYWDYGLIEELFRGFETKEVESLPEGETGIVVIPARSHYNQVDKINQELRKMKGVVLFLMGDEESVFPNWRIKHPNIKKWVQNPRPKLPGEYRKLGCGYPQAINNVENLPEKTYDFFFAGQMTHNRRYICVSHLFRLENGYIHTSSGFAEGLEQNEYYQKMSQAKVAPCPAGPQTVDTFRLFEALELGCVPIADNETNDRDWTGFWEWLFEEPIPFPTINEYDDLPGYIDDCVRRYPELNNRVQAWWIRYKNKLNNWLIDDIEAVGGSLDQDKVTFIIPVSPIPSHPETHILEETINSIRFHYPNAPIMITFDGVRKEQDDLRPQYEEHIRRILWKIRQDNIIPYVFDEHLHQSGMMRRILNDIQTDLIMYVEQDTPIVIDEPIDWKLIEEALISGRSNSIRLHHEGRIPEEHSHLMIGKPEGKLLKTVQWSQRPHMATKAFYRRVLSEYFSADSNCFIEDLLHGRLIEAFKLDGELGWEQWRTHIYIPGKNIKRSYHTDGRQNQEKYDDKQKW